MKSKSTLLDKFYKKMYDANVIEFYYRGIDIGRLSTRFFAGKHINDKNLISTVEKDNIDELVFKYSKDNKNISIKRLIKNYCKDLLRAVYYTFKSYHVNADIYFFISNPKFIKYFDSLKDSLEEKAITYAYIFWDKNDIPISFPYKKVILKPAITNIYTKWRKPDYFLFSIVDRFINTARRIKESKIVIPEGCLASMHVIGELGKVYNYKTFCLQWGFFGRSATKVGWRDMPYDKFLVWGEFFEDQFKKYNSLRIDSVGHPNLELTHKQFRKTFILFAVQKELGDHISITDVTLFLKNVNKIAKSLPDQKFVLRTHPDLPFNKLPFNPLSNINNLIIHEYNQYSLLESFEGAKLCISISSTVVIESLASNCYPVYVKSNELPLQIHDVFENISNLQHVFEFKELIKFIENFDYNTVYNHVLCLKKKLFSTNTILKEILSE